MSKPAITSLTGLNVQPSTYGPLHGFYVPQLTETQRNALSTNEVRNGGLVYNSTANALQAYINNAWVTLEAGGGAAPVIAQSLGADPDVAAGTIYYNTVRNVFRDSTNAAWNTLYQTTDATGVLIPTIAANAGALPAAPVAGMIVYETDTANFKVYSTAWNTLTSTPNVAGFPTIPTAAYPPQNANSVVYGKAVAAGTLYLDTTAEANKLWTCTVGNAVAQDATWVGVAVA